MTIKHYTVLDPLAVPRLEAWVSVRQNRAQLFTQQLGSQITHSVVIDDHQGMAPVSPAFESEFAGSVQQTLFPE